VDPSSNGAGPRIQMILDELRHVQEAQALFCAATAMVNRLVKTPVVTGSTPLPGYTPRVRVSDSETAGESSSSEATVETNREDVGNEGERYD
jgi:hypothetical protein